MSERPEQPNFTDNFDLAVEEDETGVLPVEGEPVALEDELGRGGEEGRGE